MKKVPHLSLSIVLLPLFFVLCIWLVYWLDWSYFYLQLYEFGIYPRTWIGLRGVLFSPFIHGDLKHLYHNSLALFVLLLLLQYFYKKQTSRVIVYGILLSGLFTWLFARTSYHIGASGLIYVMISFIFFKGMRTRYYRLMAVSFVVVVIYGGAVWYMFPSVEEGISWEGHLSGFIVGFILSVWIEEPDIPEKYYRYEWQRPDYDERLDPFMQCFDDQGNFVLKPRENSNEMKNPYRLGLPVIPVDYLSKYVEKL
ncbi:rhomboid family intramembrane serine protease [Myroides pelagicus]|uniref:Rhomboid family intramembrane serine protease n=1 Tax=Myroides pelagicus TaxID=270914 RepID=A0A7K1GJP6_9FLAO|nr:rhomboid family intramembrane serine protease [Myroides pelagicus]MTH28739.1 rhomboid family intramembrane serine protease [Myroides pelagicus]